MSKPPLIVGICGYARAGKDTVAAGLVEQLGFRRIAFADALKRDIITLDPYLRPGRRRWFRSSPGVRVTDTLREFEGDLESLKAHYPEWRRLLQVYGTEVHREIDPNYWRKRLVTAIYAEVDAGTAAPGYVVPDVRFDNEAEICNVLLRVERPGVGPANDHESERYAEKLPASAVIVNDSTPAEAQAQAVRYVKIVAEIASRRYDIDSINPA